MMGFKRPPAEDAQYVPVDFNLNSIDPNLAQHDRNFNMTATWVQLGAQLGLCWSRVGILGSSEDQFC